MASWTMKAETVADKRLAHEPDYSEVRRALQLFADPGAHLFLQSFPSKKWKVCAAADHDAVCDAVKTWNDGRSFFFGINPCGPLTEPLKDTDILCRHWLFIDIDRNKTLQPDDPATDQEHEDAKELAHEILTYLGQIGFPAPIQVDSGNGFHLYYRVDLPNDQASKAIVRDALTLLDNTFSDARGDVGAECHDARRLSRLPGTWSRRGKDSKTRPYRLARFLHVPETISLVPTELLAKLVNRETPIAGTGTVTPIIPEPEKKNAFVLSAAPANKERKKAYAQSAIDAERGKIAMAPQGQRNNQLFKSAAALYELVAGGLLDGMTVKDALFAAAIAAGLDKDPGCGDKGILQTIESGKKHGLEKPRQLPPPKPDSPAAPAAVNGATASATQIDPTQPIIDLASEIKPRKVEWLWPGRIPLGKLTTFAGNGGLGKTFVLTDIAARISRGDGWPDGTNGNQPGKVLYVSGEDDPDDTLVPRLIAAGANLANVAFFKPEVLGTFTLADIPRLDLAAAQLSGRVPIGAVQMVAIDPPTAYLGGINDHKNSELRSLLTPLALWAGKNRIAVVFISHVSKPQGARVEALMRVIGGVAWVNAVRAAHMFAKHPDEPDRRLFVGMKSNLGRERKGLSYRLASVDPNEIDGAAKVEWLGEVETTADEAVNHCQPEKKNRSQRAAEWLIERFREKLEWESDDLFAAGEREGITRKAIFEAKELLDLPKARRIKHLGGDVSWQWWVPHDWKALGKAHDTGTVGPIDTLAGSAVF